jgi:hypothetical protein
VRVQGREKMKFVLLLLAPGHYDDATAFFNTRTEGIHNA